MSKKKAVQDSGKKIPKSISLNEPWYSRNAIPLLIVLVLLVYVRSIALGFTYLDDTIFILEKGGDNEKLSNIFKVFNEGCFMPKDIYYRPLFRVTFIIERQILYLFPINDFGNYSIQLAHITNMILHAVSVCLLFHLLRKFSFSRENSFLWSAVFAVHPVLTMAVAWIPGRNDLMLAIFLFAYFIHFLSYIETRKTKNLIWMLVFLLLGFFTKETSVFIPLVSGIYLLIFQSREILKPKYLILYAAFVFETALWYLMRKRVYDPSSEQSIHDTISTITERVPGLIQYIGKIFFPFNLTVYPTIADTTFLFGIIAIAVALVFIFLNKERQPKNILFGAAWFILFILPFFFVPKKINDALYEHRLYIPFLGGIFIFREALPSITKILKGNWKIAYGAVLLIFSGMTFFYMNSFSDEITFYKKAVTDSPSSGYATNMLGIRLQNAGKDEEALPYFQKAFSIDTNLRYTRYFLATLDYMKRDSFEHAKKLLIAETLHTPGYAPSYFELAHIAFLENNKPGIIFYLKKCCELAPLDDVMNKNLLRAYIQQGDKINALNQIAVMQKNGIEPGQDLINSVNALH